MSALFAPANGRDQYSFLNPVSRANPNDSSTAVFWVMPEPMTTNLCPVTAAERTTINRML